MSIRGMRSGVWFAAIASVLCSCGPNGAATPAPSHGPAFDMIVLRQVPCASEVSATTCLRVRVTNRGDRAGDGSCRPRATEVSANGQMAVFGERLSLQDVASGEVVTATLAWTKKLPNPPNFGGDCEPGLRL
jgi:hypothetical protein